MASTDSLQAGYEGQYVDGFQLYLQRSQEHKVIREFIDRILPDEFARIAEGKKSLNVLGVGSGGGELDAHILSVLQTKVPGTSINADVLEPSHELNENFKALVAKTPNLQKLSFNWHSMTCAEYETMVKNKKETKRFDLVHMIQMLFYVTDLKATVKFFHSLLRDKGKLLIIHEAASSGWNTLWKTYKEELCKRSLSDYLSAGDIKDRLQELGLKYEEHALHNTVDITMCFDKADEMGEKLLDFMTDQVHFHQSLNADVRAGILDLLQNKCSTKKDGRIMFDCSLTALLVYP
ncbi:histamine N-methyltransferase-like [Anguilla rostrata]|uniref:histamine N-methyltransferase-like n=1 Tax=Anguilla rostrata TaxID=7938 RepID=UPI0030D40E1F